MKKVVNVQGMHCTSCEVLIERNLRKIPGILSVKVNRVSNTAEIAMSRDISTEYLSESLQSSGYSLSDVPQSPVHKKNAGANAVDKKKLGEISATAVLILGLYMLLSQFNLIPSSPSISDNMSLGIVLVIGLLASASTCMALAGGLLLAISARHCQANPEMKGTEKFRMHIFFNAGRVVSYAVFGGLIGLLGSVFMISSQATGILTILASIMMIVVGLQLLKVFPWLDRIKISLPKSLSNHIYEKSETQCNRISSKASFLFGGSTFFLPCGFTIALQLYVLSKGDFLTGMLTMLVFSIGTLPSLVSIGTLTSFVKGGLSRNIMTFSAVLIIILGLFNIPAGLSLTGSVAAQSTGPVKQQLENIKLVDGKQVAEMKVVGYEYYPSRFSIIPGVPVEWVIDGTKARGCASVITVPGLGITQRLSADGKTVIKFTAQKEGLLPFSCTMGMTTRGAAFNVVKSNIQAAACDPSITSCQRE